MKNAQIIKLETELTRAIAAATAAQKALSAARDEAGVSDPRAFYTVAEVDEIRAEEKQTRHVVIDATRATYDPKYESKYTAYSKFAGFKFTHPDDYTPAQRAQANWVMMIAAASEIAKQQKRGETPSQEDLDAFTRANAIAAGQVVELPSGDLAKKIIAAGRKARNEL